MIEPTKIRMSICLDETSTFNETCPSPDDELSKFAKYWSFFLNNNKSLYVHQWFDGNPFAANSSSPSFLAAGKVSGKGEKSWRNIIRERLGGKRALITCDIPPMSVVLKCFHLPEEEKFTDSTTRALLYEQRVYSCVISNFDQVPFFVYPLAIVKKKYKVGDYERQTRKGSIDGDIMDRWGTDTGTFRITVSENCGPLTFYAFLKASYEREIWKAVIQILTALRLMQENNIVHNDLHFKNILVKKLSAYSFDVVKRRVVMAEEVAQYNSQEQENLVKMRYMAKIFDWDRAHSDKVSTRLGPNPMADDIEVHLTTFNQSYDMVSFIKQMRRYYDLPQIDALDRLQQHYPWVLKPWHYKGSKYWHLTCYEDGRCSAEWPLQVHGMVKEAAESLYNYAVAQVYNS